MPRGGPQPGSGRPRKVDEEKITTYATKAIEKRFGSLEAGFEWLLGSGEPSLIKFAFEHAAGKPRDKVGVTVDMAKGQKFKIGDSIIEF